MDRYIYVNILWKSLLGTLKQYGLDCDAVYFQQDGNSKHTLKHALGFLDVEGIDLLPWSPNSPDMSPIKNLWDYLDHLVCARDPWLKNLDELWLALKEEWESIPQSFVDKLYCSMSSRLRDLLKANGHHTCY